MQTEAKGVYYTVEPSITARGWVGLVIDSASHRTVLRTAVAYADASLAMVAARREWQGRQVAEVAA